jgi:DNA primase
MYDRDEVLRRTDLRALLGELSGPARGHGHGARWHCPVPDHDDVHPSVTVRVDRRGMERWKCWSFGHGGTAIDALYYARGVNYQGALEELARRVGIAPDEPGVRTIRRPLKPRAATPLQPPAVKYVEACERLLWEPVGRRVLEYLVDGRGLDPDVLRANRVGADPGTSKLRRAGGLPKYGPGVVLPAVDADGQLVYFQTRYLDPHPDRSKYGNPAGRHGDNPRHGWTRPVGDAKEPLVICEGFPDAYVANSAGYAAVAVLGTGNATAILAEQIAPRLRGRPVLLALDGDDAGQAAAKHLRVGFDRCGIMVVELPLPPGTDLNSWVQSARQVPGLGRPARPISQQPIAVAPAGVLAPAPVIPGP